MANLRTNNLSGEQGQNAIRGSVFFDGTGDKLSVPNSADVRLGSNDFTMEAWVRFGDVQGYWDSVLGMYDESADRRTYYLARYRSGGAAEDGRLYMYVNTDGTSGGYQNVQGGFVSINDWHHVAGVRDGNTLRLYINGVQVGTSSFSGTIYNNTTDALFIGDVESDDNKIMNGFISNVRLINGTCIYPNGTTFTPPQHELTLVPNTVLLACQNSDDVTQEATGKTITAAGNLTDAAYVRMQPKVIPPCGRDAGNAFGGTIQQSSQGYMYFPTGKTEERVIVNNNFGARGLIMGGITYPGAGYVNVIESIQIASLGDSVDFGDLTNKPNGGAGFSSKIRGFVAGGNTPEGYGVNVIQFVTIATAGNASDFGDVGYTRSNGAGVSNNTRGVYSGGESASSPNPSLNNIEFVTMSTSGNGQDFGDLIDAASTMHSASSPTRGLYLGGYRDGEVNFIDFLTISTTGNTQDFGDLVNTARNGNGGVSNGHRGIVMGGYSSPARTNVIQYVTIQSTGNALDFGDLTDARDPAVTSSLTRGIACTGDYPSNVNIIDFIEIMTTGNAVDFGDMTTKTSSAQSCSNAHGGLADDM